MKNELIFTQDLVYITLTYSEVLSDELFKFEMKNKIFSLRGFSTCGPAYKGDGKYSSTHFKKTGIYIKKNFEKLMKFCEEIGIDILEEEM